MRRNVVLAADFNKEHIRKIPKLIHHCIFASDPRSLHPFHGSFHEIPVASTTALTQENVALFTTPKAGATLSFKQPAWIPISRVRDGEISPLSIKEVIAIDTRNNCIFVEFHPGIVDSGSPAVSLVSDTTSHRTTGSSNNSLDNFVTPRRRAAAAAAASLAAAASAPFTSLSADSTPTEDDEDHEFDSPAAAPRKRKRPKSTSSQRVLPRVKKYITDSRIQKGLDLIKEYYEKDERVELEPLLAFIHAVWVCVTCGRDRQSVAKKAPSLEHAAFQAIGKKVTPAIETLIEAHLQDFDELREIYLEWQSDPDRTPPTLPLRFQHCAHILFQDAVD